MLLNKGWSFVVELEHDISMTIIFSIPDVTNMKYLFIMDSEAYN